MPALVEPWKGQSEETLRVWRWEACAIAGLSVIGLQVPEPVMVDSITSSIVLSEVIEGKSRLEYRAGPTTHRGPGHLAIVTPDMRYRVTYEPGISTGVMIEPDLAERYGEQFSGRHCAIPRFAGWALDAPELARNLRGLRRSIIRGAPSLLVEQQFTALMARLCGLSRIKEAAAKCGLETIAVRRVCDYLRQIDPGDEIEVADLESVSGVSRYYLFKAFRSQTGTTPFDFVMRYRTQRAWELIVGGARVIAAVAHACGFTDQAHLARRFRAQFGMTPTALIAAL